MVGPQPAWHPAIHCRVQVLKGEIERIHAAEWKNLNSRWQANIFVKEPGVARAPFLLSLKKWDMDPLVGFLAGHRSLKYHMGKIGVVVTPAAYVKRRRLCTSYALPWPPQILVENWEIISTKDLRTLNLWKMFLKEKEKLANTTWVIFGTAQWA